MKARLLNDGFAARVDAEVLEGCAEVRHVRLHPHAQHLQRARIQGSYRMATQ